MKYRCAGIVTYNPDIKRLKKNIESIYSSLETLIIVDNYSSNIVDIIDLIKDYSKITLIKNKENLGIATALNEIVNLSIKLEYQWTLLLDQDSICDSRIISEYKEYLLYPNVGLLCPYIIDINKINLNQYKKLSLPKYSKVKYAITSGTLIKNEIFSKVGGFWDELFIDAVDIDYSEKLRINGFEQIRVNTTYLLQEVGHAEKTKILRIHRDHAGKFRFIKVIVNIVFRN